MKNRLSAIQASSTRSIESRPESASATVTIATSAKVTIAACVLVAFCEGFDLQAAGVAAPGIAGELRPTPDQLGTFFSASTLGLFAGALVGGRMSDSFGRKRILVLSVGLFGVFSILTAAARSIEVLSWARLLTGAGLGGAFPNLLALVNESSSAHRRNANVALAYSGAPFGGAVASLISMIGSGAHWRLIFISGGLVPLLLVPILLRVLRESAEFERTRSASAPSGPADSLPTPATPHKGSFIAIFSNGRAVPTLLLWVSSFLALLTLYLMLSWLPTLLVGNGLSKAQAAGVQVGFNVGGGIAALLIGQLLEGKARNPSIIVVLVCMPLFVLLLARAPSDLWLVGLIVFALGASVVGGQGFLYATAPRCYPTLIRGVGVGTAVAMGRLGSIVGPKLGGALRAAGHTSSQLLSDIVPLVVLGSAAALVFAWRTARWRDS